MLMILKLAQITKDYAKTCFILPLILLSDQRVRHLVTVSQLTIRSAHLEFTAPSYP